MIKEEVKEKRKGVKPIPSDLHNYINEAQQAVLNKIQDFGWSLQFIRRPSFQEPVVVAAHISGTTFGVLETDGYFDMRSDLVIREYSS